MTLAELDQLFAPEQFRACGHALIDALAEQLAKELSSDAQLIAWQPPREAELAWQQTMPELPTLHPDDFSSWLQQSILPRNLAMHHPHSMAHQAAPPLPMAALADLVASLTNQAMAIYETGPVATLIERQLIHWMSSMIGWPNASGVLTSGGSQANLTALLAARQQIDQHIWSQGIATRAPNLRILTSALSHHSISRAAGIMGLGTETVIAVDVDAEGCLNIEALRHAHRTCMAQHQHVMAVVATAGCTATGSIDPLQAIGEYCQSQGIWLHIDAAHGASALLSTQHRVQLDGIALANSVTWDAHKLLYMPASASAVIFRDQAASYHAFSQTASYLFHEDEETEAYDFNLSLRTLECTKRMMGLKLLAAFKLYGRQGLASLIEHVFAQAKALADMLKHTAGFELLMPPQTNIVCFRYLDHGQLTPAQLNILQPKIRQKLLHQGLFHLSQVELGGCIWLRCVLMNPYTQSPQQLALLQQIKQIGHDLVTRMSSRQ